jgi:uncharacterized protein (TIGR02996 family)
MTDILASVFENKSDLETLSVYADWLQDRDDSRADYVQSQIELRQSLNTHAEREPTLSSLRQNYPMDELPWVTLLEQAGVFAGNLCVDNLASSNFEFGDGIEPLNTERFAELPPFDAKRLGNHFQWLSQPPIRRANTHTQKTREELLPWAELIERLQQEGYGFPEDFELLMLDTELQSFLPSRTDDYFLDANSAEANITSLNDGTLYLPFYADSQWGAVYGLRLNQQREPYTPVLIGHPDYVDETDQRFEYHQHAVIGSSLESFVYQMWLENHHWYATVSRSGQRELTEEEKRFEDFSSRS